MDNKPKEKSLKSGNTCNNCGSLDLLAKVCRKPCKQKSAGIKRKNPSEHQKKKPQWITPKIIFNHYHWTNFTIQAVGLTIRWARSTTVLKKLKHSLSKSKQGIFAFHYMSIQETLAAFWTSQSKLQCRSNTQAVWLSKLKNLNRAPSQMIQIILKKKYGSRWQVMVGESQSQNSH